MDPNSILSFLAAHQGLFASAVPLALSAAHSRLQRWPIAQVLARYAGVLPVMRIFAVELAQAVVAQWGPQEKADIATVVSELQQFEPAEPAPTGPVGPVGPVGPAPVQTFNIDALRAAHPELAKKPQPPYGG